MSNDREESVSNEVQAFGFHADEVVLALPKVRTVRNCPIDEDAIEAELASTRRGEAPLPHWMTTPAGFRQPAPPTEPVHSVFLPMPKCGPHPRASSSTSLVENK